VHGLLHVLGQQAEDVRGAVGPLLEPPGAVLERVEQRVVVRAAAEVVADGDGRLLQRGVQRAQPDRTSSASTIVYA
jgi:hypothetical protein